jgi:hypothetical protein
VSFKTNISEEISEDNINTDVSVKPTPNIQELFKKIKRKPTIDIDHSSFSIKEEIEHLIRKQDSLIAENIEVKKRLNILLNKI